MAVFYRAKQAMCGGGGMAISTHNLCARRGRLVSATPPAALPPGKRPGTHRTGGWVGLDFVRKISALSGFESGPSIP